MFCAPGTRSKGGKLQHPQKDTEGKIKYLERQSLLEGGKPQYCQIFPPWAVQPGCKQIPLSSSADTD